MNIIAQLSNYLKYGLIGLVAILAILAFILLKNEQRKSPRRSSIIKGIYVFMVMCVILFLFLILAPTTRSKQEANTVLEGSSHNTVTTQQSKGDSAMVQRSNTRLSQSDSNKVKTVQMGGKDSVKID